MQYQPGDGGSPPVPTASAPPAAQQQAPPGSIQTSPGYTPDYKSLIENDPSYEAFLQAAQQQQANASAQRRAALRQAVLRYGGLPNGWSDAYGDIDQATLDAAKNNQNSTLSNLQYNYGQSVRQFMQQLAARGALQSGELNFGQDQLDRGLSQQRYDAANSFGDTATGYENSYANVLDQIAQERGAAIQAAEAAVAGNPAYAPQQATYASYDPTLSSIFGTAVYHDPNTGQSYTADGSKLGSGGPG